MWLDLRLQCAPFPRSLSRSRTPFPAPLPGCVPTTGTAAFCLFSTRPNTWFFLWVGCSGRRSKKDVFLFFFYERREGRRPPRPRPRPPPMAASSGCCDCGLRMVSSTDRIRHAASAADCR